MGLEIATQLSMKNLMVAFLLSLLAFTFSLWPLNAAALSTPGFDVNDVTFLFPLQNNSALIYPELSFSGTIGGEILSPTLFSKVDQTVQTFSKVKTRLPYKAWRIVALRYDPCFPS